MNITTASIHVTAPKTVVVNFLSDLKTLPAWATECCQSIENTTEGWVVQTANGALMVDVDAHAATGVIDMKVGPTADEMGGFPIRVIGMPDGSTLVSFCFIQAPDVSDEVYAIQYQSLLIELRGLAERFEGTVHAPLSAFNAVEAMLV
ncbi:MAG: hypothetical protein J6386_07120 [Candidatus Synoicihabitans palmerolidicus]|nr:hypothetical protein [Candidatus Synoicihabitans palmerolidicus]